MAQRRRARSGLGCGLRPTTTGAKGAGGGRGAHQGVVEAGAVAEGENDGDRRRKARAPAGAGDAGGLRAPGHRGSMRGGPVKGMGRSARPEKHWWPAIARRRAHRRLGFNSGEHRDEGREHSSEVDPGTWAELLRRSQAVGLQWFGVPAAAGSAPSRGKAAAAIRALGRRCWDEMDPRGGVGG
jgi:hypothetical protein